MMIFNKIHYPSSLCVSTNQVMSSSEKNQERRGNYKKNYKKNYKNWVSHKTTHNIKIRELKYSAIQGDKINTKTVVLDANVEKFCLQGLFINVKFFPQ